LTNNQPGKARDIAASVKISAVYRALTGIDAKHHRGIAVWRDGKARSVALSDTKGTWFDHAAGEGGGVIDLVRRVRACDAQEALHWLAEYAGIPLDDKPIPPAERRRYAREKRLLDRDMPIALMWRRAAIAMAEQVLCDLKTKLWDTTDIEVDMHAIVLEIQARELLLSQWQRLAGTELVETYRSFLCSFPTLTSGMLKALRRRQGVEGRVAWRWIFGVTE